jgi:hypothetical protein
MEETENREFYIEERVPEEERLRDCISPENRRVDLTIPCWWEAARNGCAPTGHMSGGYEESVPLGIPGEYSIT